MIPRAHGPVRQRSSWSRGRAYRSAAALLVLLSLLVGLWLSLRCLALPPDGLTWSVPLPRGGAITVRVWTHDLAFSPAYTTGGLTRQTPGPLRLTIEVQRTAASLRQQLAVLPVPTWPVLMPVAVLALTVLGRWYGRSRRHG